MVGAVSSKHCKSGAHCDTCRAWLGGKEWRASIAENFDDVPEVNFVCPHGRKMNLTENAEERTHEIRPEAKGYVLHNIVEGMVDLLPAERAGVGKHLWHEGIHACQKSSCRSCCDRSLLQRLQHWLTRELDKLDAHGDTT